MDALKITVHNAAGVSGSRPVTGGVPIAEGAAPAGTQFMLQSADGTSIPLQAEVLAQWKDGSARWVLLDFATDGSEESTYSLSWGERSESNAQQPVHQTDEGTGLIAGDLSVIPVDHGAWRIADRFDITLTLTDENGQMCQAVPTTTRIETSGSMRSTLALSGDFLLPDRNRLFQFRLYVSLYAGGRFIRLQPMIIVDANADIIQRARALQLKVKPVDHLKSADLCGAWQGLPNEPVRLFQYDDQNYRLEGAEGSGKKASGWSTLTDHQGKIALALRDFWQQWPKSLEADAGGVAIGLFPEFSEGDYAHMEPWYKYQYLFNGNCYQLRTGQARRWDVWLDLEGDGPALSQMADAPFLPVADPAQAIETGVWDAIAPGGTTEMKTYDAWAENLFNAYCESIAVQRDYGEMNWGDWFGERQVNWGNHEYDTPNQLLIQFARTGDPKYFYTADTAARHSAEVDVVHFVNDDLADYFTENWGRKTYPPRAGLVHQHAVGHVGGFYPVEQIRALFIEKGVGNSERPYLCLDPFNLGHVWTQGMVRHYFLTGDPFVRETVEKIGDNLARLVEDREYQFMGTTHCGRVTGWPLLALAGVYELTLDDRFLNAMKTLADDALADQDPVCGGWLIHPMAPDHCLCQTARHTGMAGFITAVLINGLSRYALLSNDARLPDAIDRAVTFLDNDTWREEWRDWRYTSCPATRATGQPGVVVMAHVNSVRIADNSNHLRVLDTAWKAKFERLLEAPKPGPGQGKTYTSKMYGCAEAIGLLASRGMVDA